MRKNHSVVEIKTYSSVKRFMSDLAPSSPAWHSQFSSWIFRGQRDSRWKLIPSVFRSEAWIHNQEEFKEQLDNFVQLRIELLDVQRFARLADRQGLPVPGYDYTWANDDLFTEESIRAIMDAANQTKQIPLPDWYSLFGMAQHYGIRTRLLDWTESPKTACYFAANEMAELIHKKQKEANKYIAVWALNFQVFKFLSPNRYKKRIISFTPPWNSNPNLRAQKGLFTLILEPLTLHEHPKIITIEDFVNDEYERFINDDSIPKVVIKQILDFQTP
ncbi:MAG: FRG domain-containing protein [Anaerolineaceae bacterium]